MTKLKAMDLPGVAFKPQHTLIRVKSSAFHRLTAAGFRAIALDAKRRIYEYQVNNSDLQRFLEKIDLDERVEVEDE